ncbi:MAG: translation elongation factor Ts [Oscillospiraceae bacterium]|jgi:elongation factor Ts|nr:translation elongation factor Ts [Oscillospiraceae bacterium]
MSFTAKDVQALRELTGAGMMDCKKALLSCDGDQAKAIDYLREKGLAAAAKKSGRIAAEGACCAVACPQGCGGSVVEVNSETDFAAKSEKFQAFVRQIAVVVGKEAPEDLPRLMAAEYAPGLTVEQALREHIYTIGENIVIRRFSRNDKYLNAPYIHAGGKIAVLVMLDVSDSLKGSPDVAELGRFVAMQVAAMRPLWLGDADVCPQTLEKEREIITAQVEQEEKDRAEEAAAKGLPYKAKPPQVTEKIIEGRVRKYLDEVCLLRQPFVRENSLSVAQYVAQRAKELGGGVAVVGFERFETGEGLAKREDDFAAEVARAAQG